MAAREDTEANESPLGEGTSNIEQLDICITDPEIPEPQLCAALVKESGTARQNLHDLKNNNRSPTKPSGLHLERLGSDNFRKMYLGLSVITTLTILWLCTFSILVSQTPDTTFGAFYFWIRFSCMMAIRCATVIVATMYLQKLVCYVMCRQSQDKCSWRETLDEMQLFMATIALASIVIALASIALSLPTASTALTSSTSWCRVEFPLVRNLVSTVQAMGYFGIMIYTLLFYRYVPERVPPSKLLTMVTIVTIYGVTRVSLFTNLRIVLDYIPLSNYPRILRLYALQRSSNYSTEALAIISDCMIGCSVLCVLECVLMLYVGLEWTRTKTSMNTLFIQDVRRHVIAFHYFMTQHVNFTLALIVGAQVSIWCLPYSHVVQSFLISDDALDQTYFCMGGDGNSVGFCTLHFVWVAALLFGALPPAPRRENGVSPSSVETQEDDIQYFVHEGDVTTETVKVNPRHFILEHQLEMFNFAYLAYAAGHPSYRQDSIYFSHMIANPLYKLVVKIDHVGSDTHVIIAQSDTRIIVAFKGSTSLANVRTDMKVVKCPHEGAAGVLMEGLPKSDPNEFKPSSVHMAPNVWASAKPWVHLGFATAYATVASNVLSTIDRLLKTKSRIVCLTGHSLGGALATLCSVDVVTRLGHTGGVTCTTFGSPKVGGLAFTRVYNHLVPATFRFSTTSDIVTRTPVNTLFDSFVHVGTCVMLDTRGNMLVNPNLLEAKFMTSSEMLNAGSHKLTSYQAGLLLWCIRAHETSFRPRFWPHSLQKLRKVYGHKIPEIARYLHRSSIYYLDASSENTCGKSPAELAQVLAQHLTKHQTSKWTTIFRLTKGRDYYVAEEAIRYLVKAKEARNRPKAVEVCRILVAQGYIELVRGCETFTASAHFILHPHI